MILSHRIRFTILLCFSLFLFWTHPSAAADASLYLENPQPTVEVFPALQNSDIKQIVDVLFGAPELVLEGQLRNTTLWDKIRSGFRLPNLDTALIQKWENYYTKRPAYFERAIARARPYLFHIVSEVEKQGMPMEIALLPVIESAYNPKAQSCAKAVGLWQFIPGTGRRYGLAQTSWYDGRRDVIVATRAALAYLRTLYAQFQDWALALAAYNWGENALARALAKHKARGLPPTYWDLPMPKETRHYLPKLMAVRNIIADPAAFGVRLNSIPNRPYFKAVSTTQRMDLKVAAELSETPLKELLTLNPGLIRPILWHKDTQTLVLPIDKAETFQRKLLHYDKPFFQWKPYVSQRGDTLVRIAGVLGLSAHTLAEINAFPPRAALRGQTILIPATAVTARLRLASRPSVREFRKKSAPRPRLAVQRLRRGNALFSIARSRYKVRAQAVKRWRLKRLRQEKTSQRKPV